MNYMQAEGSSTTYRRSCGGKFVNICATEPVIMFDEEDVSVVVVDGKETTFHKHLDGYLKAVLNANTAAKEFNLVHPDTGAVIGSMSWQSLFVAVRSFWVSLAKERDEAQVVTPVDGSGA
jgi:hypothetical protein